MVPGKREKMEAGHRKAPENSVKTIADFIFFFKNEGLEKRKHPKNKLKACLPILLSKRMGWLLN